MVAQAPARQLIKGAPPAAARALPAAARCWLPDRWPQLLLALLPGSALPPLQAGGMLSHVHLPGSSGVVGRAEPGGPVLEGAPGEHLCSGSITPRGQGWPEAWVAGVVLTAGSWAVTPPCTHSAAGSPRHCTQSHSHKGGTSRLHGAVGLGWPLEPLHRAALETRSPPCKSHSPHLGLGRGCGAQARAARCPGDGSQSCQTVHCSQLEETRREEELVDHGPARPVAAHLG